MQEITPTFSKIFFTHIFRKLKKFLNLSLVGFTFYVVSAYLFPLTTSSVFLSPLLLLSLLLNDHSFCKLLKFTLVKKKDPLLTMTLVVQQKMFKEKIFTDNQLLRCQ